MQQYFSSLIATILSSHRIKQLPGGEATGWTSGEKRAADREDNQAAGSSKAYQQQYLQKAHGKIYHTLCAADEVTSLHTRSWMNNLWTAKDWDS